MKFDSFIKQILIFKIGREKKSENRFIAMKAWLIFIDSLKVDWRGMEMEFD